MYQMERTQKRLLGDQIEDALMEYICQDDMKLGTKLPNELNLAEKFGVGRSTIREAVKSLATKGVLEVRRGSGTYVIAKNYVEDDPLGLSKLEDKYKLALELLDVRLMLEPEIAAKAAECATPEQIESMRTIANEVEELYMSGKDHMKKDIELHKLIARSSRNRVVEMLVPIINSAITTSVNLTYRKLRDETISSHRAIIESIENHDSTGARCAMIMHLNYNRQLLYKYWKENQSKEKSSDNFESKIQ